MRSRTAVVVGFVALVAVVGLAAIGSTMVREVLVVLVALVVMVAGGNWLSGRTMQRRPRSGDEVRYGTAPVVSAPVGTAPMGTAPVEGQVTPVPASDDMRCPMAPWIRHDDAMANREHSTGAPGDTAALAAGARTGPGSARDGT